MSFAFPARVCAIMAILNHREKTMDDAIIAAKRWTKFHLDACKLSTIVIDNAADYEKAVFNFDDYFAAVTCTLLAEDDADLASTVFKQFVSILDNESSVGSLWDSLKDKTGRFAPTVEVSDAIRFKADILDDMYAKIAKRFKASDSWRRCVVNPPNGRNATSWQDAAVVVFIEDGEWLLSDGTIPETDDEEEEKEEPPVSPELIPVKLGVCPVPSSPVKKARVKRKLSFGSDDEEPPEKKAAPSSEDEEEEEPSQSRGLVLPSIDTSSLAAMPIGHMERTFSLVCGNFHAQVKYARNLFESITNGAEEESARGFVIQRSMYKRVDWLLDTMSDVDMSMKFIRSEIQFSHNVGTGALFSVVHKCFLEVLMSGRLSKDANKALSLIRHGAAAGSKLAIVVAGVAAILVDDSADEECKDEFGATFTCASKIDSLIANNFY